MSVYSARRSIDTAPWRDPDAWPVVDLAMPPLEQQMVATQAERPRRAVLLSVLGADRNGRGLATLAAEREAAVLPHLEEAVILRIGPVVDDLSIYVEGLRTYGGAAHAYGSAPLAWLTAADVADAAARAVAAPHDAPIRAFDLPGATLMSVEALVVAVAGTPEAAVWDVSPDELIRELSGSGAPPATIQAIAGLQGWAAGCTEPSGQLARVLGRAPADLVATLRAATDAAVSPATTAAASDLTTSIS